ncbi:nitrate- and nitrite sensing domain-containing protein [Streptomyces sp. enrichment culture]|uniref:sensor histidine kinase n=1 Tax=Streptomyces sp. enrichment culture TaxID=1795815 RepID=UPI003F57781E
MRKKQRRTADVPQATATGSGAGAPADVEAVTPAPRRRARVRNRLLLSVLVTAAAVAGAGAPTLIAGSRDTAAAQALVDLARLDQQAIALSHSLEDERDGMVEYIAAGRSGQGDAKGAGAALRARVDRQARELRAAADSAPTGSATPSDAPAAAVKALKKLPSVRQQAKAGRGTALESYKDYSGIIEQLRRITRDVAGNLPARAQDRTAAALPDLARAIDQAAATRGLLEGALAGTGTQRQLVTEAMRTRVGEQAALADFEETAGPTARDRFSTTVNGTDVSVAERYLDRLTAQPYLSPQARATDVERFDSAASARVAHMRGVQSAFAAAEVKRLEKLRDDDVTALQVRAGLVGGCLLIALALSVATARSLTRPLSVLKRGSQRLAKDPAGEEPITFRGRNDEFADVVRSLNTLRGTAAELRRRSSYAEREQDQLAVEKAQLTERHQLLSEDFDTLRSELEEARERLRAAAHGTADAGTAPQSGGDRGDGTGRSTAADAGTPETHDASDKHEAFADLATRTLTLVERQLGIIEGLEEKEADPDRLDTLFKLDHLATRMRRHSENLLLIAGTERGAREGLLEYVPAPLLDVLRAAVSEIAQYERVELGTVPQEVRVSGPAADDLSHLIAELLDNAAAFSPSGTGVRLTARTAEDGEAVVTVEDEGSGMSEYALAELNARLATPATAAEDPSAPWNLGLYIVARLSARHGVRVRLRRREEGGITAEVTVPQTLLSAGTDEGEHARTADQAPSPGAGTTPSAAASPGAVPAPSTAPSPDVVPTPSAAPSPGTVAPSASVDSVVTEESAAGHAAEADGPDEAQPETPAPAAAPAETVPAQQVPAEPGSPAEGPAEPAQSVEPAHAAEPDPSEPEHSAGEQHPAGAREPAVGAQHAPGADFGDVDAVDGVGGSDRDGDGADGGRGQEGRPSVPGPAPVRGSVAEGGQNGRPEQVAQGRMATHTGLPKRVRGKSEQPGTAAPKPRGGGADPEELRRKLDVFQQGSREGRRDAEAQVAAEHSAEVGWFGEAAPKASEQAGNNAVTDRSGAQPEGGTGEEAHK